MLVLYRYNEPLSWTFKVTYFIDFLVFLTFYTFELYIRTLFVLTISSTVVLTIKSPVKRDPIKAVAIQYWLDAGTFED